MYVRVTRSQCAPGLCDLVLVVAEQTNPALQRLPGFRSSFWGVDRETGALIAASIWDTQAHAAFSREALISAAVADGAGPAAERRIEDDGDAMEPPHVFELTAHVP
jgi:hypothetical protein